MYSGELPDAKQIRRAASLITIYPTNGKSLKTKARQAGGQPALIEFIELFSDNIVFDNAEDLVNHCLLLINLLSEERQAVPEILRSPQG